MNENNVFENQPMPENNPNVAEPVRPVPVEEPVYTQRVRPVSNEQPVQPAQPVYAQPAQPAQPEQPVYAAPVDVDPPAQPVQPTYAQPEQPVYAQPAQPAQPAYVPVAPAKEDGNGLAIGSLVCSIVSIVCCCGILSIVGIILGAVAKKKGYKGGMATAGIVVGAIYTGILVITAIVMAICDLLGFGAMAFMSKSIADSYYNDSYDYGYYDSYDNYDDYFDYDFDY